MDTGNGKFEQVDAANELLLKEKMNVFYVAGRSSG
jgi:hypothetical protein